MDGSEDIPEPLEADERANIEADLVDLETMRQLFQGQAVRGVVIACPDCNANHFYDWDLLRENLDHMLATGEPRMHEPAFEPKEDDYILWDYGKGYIDALTDTGLEPGRRVPVDQCPWCQTPVGDRFQYCPQCGRSLAALRLYVELVKRGTNEREARAMLVRSGFEPFGF